MYKASNPGVPLRVYFLTYENSVEEQRYLSSMRKEKEAFEKLIHQKSTMTVMRGQDGKLEWKEEDLGLEEESYDSRKGRKVLPKEKGKVLVDYREFRSSLPSFLHRRGFEVQLIHCRLHLHMTISHLFYRWFRVTLKWVTTSLHQTYASKERAFPILSAPFSQVACTATGPFHLVSLPNGRLICFRYNQTEAMTRRFKIYGLLIEFDPEKPFCLMV